MIPKIYKFYKKKNNETTEALIGLDIAMNFVYFGFFCFIITGAYWMVTR